MFSETAKVQAKSPAFASPPHLKTFHIFPNLAPELRLKIWSHACGPRILALTYNQTKDQFSTSTPPPAILSVSHESRREALLHYQLCFGTKKNNPKTYFNPYRDTLYFPRCRQMGYDDTLRDFMELVREKDVVKNVTRVAIDHVDLDIKRPWESYNKAQLLRGFRQLDEVVLVLCDKKGQANRVTNPRDEIEFVEAKEKIEVLLRLWVAFRQSFTMEERSLAEVARDLGREYNAFKLPTVRIRSKALNAAVEEDVETLLSAVRNITIN